MRRNLEREKKVKDMSIVFLKEIIKKKIVLMI